MKKTFFTQAVSNLNWVCLAYVFLFIYWNINVLLDDFGHIPIIATEPMRPENVGYGLAILQQTGSLSLPLPWFSRFLFADALTGVDGMTMLLFLVVLFLLFRFSRSIGKRQFFIRSNYRAMYGIAISLLVYCVAEAIIRTKSIEWVRSISGGRITYHFEWMPAVLTVILLYLFVVLGAAFQAGYQLKEEQRFTV